MKKYTRERVGMAERKGEKKAISQNKSRGRRTILGCGTIRRPYVKMFA